MSVELSRRERIDTIRLIRSENVGPITYRQLIERYASAGAALDALPELARRGGRKRPIRLAALKDAEEELAQIEALGARAICLGEPDYPARLAAIDDAPPVLSVKGHIHIANQTVVAIVGARNASAIGIRFARETAAALGAEGVVVASGLARGIDTAAHQGTLQTGTIAVVAGGIDVAYPPENEELQNQIAEAGLLIAEMPPGTKPQARHFPRRNRLISGLANGILVVEAAPRSGSLITARMALEQGREVFAVPGSPADPRHRGTNRLIREGAQLTESAEDILDVLRTMAIVPLEEPVGRDYRDEGSAEPDEADLATGRPIVLEKLTEAPVELDELIRQCNQEGDLMLPVILTILLELELAGSVVRHPGNKVSLG